MSMTGGEPATYKQATHGMRTGRCHRHSSSSSSSSSSNLDPRAPDAVAGYSTGYEHARLVTACA